MKRLILAALALTFGAATSLRADTSVVFNEIMYHPATNEAALEWVELRNQMAVDVDLSGWSLRGLVDYTFASNTIVRGGGFVLIALSPSTMTATTGATNGIFGPFTGRLSNGGGTLRLRNNSGRVVDEVNYGTEDEWPAAADGSGSSLAKRDRDSASGPAANWVGSEQVGGTPMGENFAVPGAVFPDTRRVAIDESWKYEASGADLGTAWRELNYNDAAWAARASLTNRAIPGLFNTGVGANGLALPNNTPDPHYILTANANGGTGSNALAILNHPSWLANNATNTFIGVINPGNTTINGGNYHFQTTFSLAGFLPASARINARVAVDNVLTDIAVNGVSSGLTFAGFAALSPTLEVSSGFMAGTNTLEFRTVNEGAGPGGFMATVSGNALAANTNAPLPLGPTTYYFRKVFTFSGNPAYTQLRLNSVVTDGAVVYLNGVEVYRQNLPAGPVTAATPALSDITEPNYSGAILIPAASLVNGANVLAVEVHQAPGSSDGPLYGADLISTPLPVPAEEMVTLAFNELASTTNAGFWLELMNTGATTQALDGFSLRLDAAVPQQYVFPPGTTLAGGSFLALTNATLGFSPESGDRLYLIDPTGTRVLDAAVAKKTLRGRSPDGTGPYLFPNMPTPGAANSFALRTEIVINEIMYHHRGVPGTNGLPVADSLESWLELHNKSTSPVDLTNWELSGGISYRFFNQTLAPGGFLVVAKDAAYLRTVYPAIPIVGNFSGNLSGRSDQIILRDPTGNPADSVRYFDNGKWAGYADGGGSSLELRDPHADNTKAEAWAASIESGKTSWQTYTYRMVAAASVTADRDATWRDFIFGLLGDGETWIDDLSVIQSPTNGPIQIISNGNFENGLTGWRTLGNHIRSSVELDPDNAGNHVLRLVATGAQEHMNNHIETTLNVGRTVQNGTLYEISFRARHIAGNNLVNTRLYFNRVARSTPLVTAALNGTPGARNSTYATNIGPTFAQFAHTPVVPAATIPVTVSVAAQDAQGVSTCEVWWSANSGAWSNAPMTLQPGGHYSGSIPGFAAATIVQFYVRAVDGLGAASIYPAAGPASGALYKVADGQANLALTHNIRIILTPDNTALLHADTNVMSNDLLPCTVIVNESRAYYDVGVHLKSSEHGRNDAARVGFHLVFQPDDPFRGVHPVMLIDRSDSGRPKGEEILLRHMALQAGVPMTHADICRVLAPRNAQTGQAILAPRYEDDFVETAFENGGDGTLYELELIYWMLTANAAGYKLPVPDSVQGLDISNVGDNKENYRYNFILKNHRNEDDYSRFIPFAKSWSVTGPTLEAQTSLTTDWDAWMRSYSLVSLMGVGDMYTFGNNHNLLAYVRPSDQKMVYFLWDMDFSFNRGSTAGFIGDQNLGRIVNAVPSIQRCFYAHVLDHVNTVFNPAYMTHWFNRYDDFTLGAEFAGAGGLTYIQQRGDFARTTINSIGGNAAFAITGTNFIVTSNNLVTLNGTAPVQVKTIWINGVEYPVTWNSISGWTLRVPVSAVNTILTLVGHDVHDRALTNFTRTINVNYTGALPAPEGLVVFNEIMYNPVTPDASFVEIFNTSTNVSFDLSNWRVNGLDYTFPAGSVLTNRQVLVLARNAAIYATTFPTAPLPFAAFSGAVQNDGETLTLLRPGALAGQEIIVDQVRYEAAAPWPVTANGTGPSLQLRDPAQDNSRVGNWSDGAGWRFFSYTANIGASVSLNLSLFLTNIASDLYLDDIAFVQGGVPEAGLNYLANGDFETPLSPKWIVGGLAASSAIVSDVARSGASSLHMVFATGSPQLTHFYQVLTNVVPQGPATGTNYTMSFWYLAGTNSLMVQTRLNSIFRFASDVRPTRSTPGVVNSTTTTLPPFPPLWLNEVQPENLSGRLDQQGEREPWLELYNAGTNAISLAGYALADNYTNLSQWLFPPDATIQPGEFKVIIADGEPGETTAEEWHTSFRPAAGSGSLALGWTSSGALQVLDYLNYTNLPAGRSYGDHPDGQPFQRQEFFHVTPGATNDNLSAPLLVHINEWMAGNSGALLNTNNNNRYDDWFELYNPGSEAADLTGYFLTDNLSNKFQFAIPAGTVIPPHGFLLVWADEASSLNSTNDPDLHVNFKLAQDGEQVGLFASDGTLIDGVTFEAQFTDRTQGRFPDGAGANYFLTTPTPRAANTIWINRHPVLDPIPDTTAYTDVPFGFTAIATDSDVPPQMLTFSLGELAPAGASIDLVSGVFTWTPTTLQTPSTNDITVRVTDNGPLALSASRTFRVIVRVPLLLGGVTRTPEGNLSFTVGTTVGKTYRVEYKNDLNDADWTALGPDQVATTTSLLVTDNIGVQPHRFYRVLQVD